MKNIDCCVYFVLAMLLFASGKRFSGSNPALCSNPVCAADSILETQLERKIHNMHLVKHIRRNGIICHSLVCHGLLFSLNVAAK